MEARNQRRKRPLQGRRRSVEPKKSKHGQESNQSSAAQAMLNQLVLELTAKQLPARDATNLRSTCKLWNNSFVGALRGKLGPIQFHSLRYNRGDQNMMPLVELMRSSSNIPLVNFNLNGLQYVTNRNITQFCAVLGNTMTRLELRNGSTAHHSGGIFPRKPVDVDQIRAIIFEHTPNLTEFRMETDYGGPPPISIEAVTSRQIPKLRKLQFGAQTIWNKIVKQEVHPVYLELLNDLLRNAVGLTDLELGTSGVNNSVVVSAAHGFLPNLDKLKSLQIANLSLDHPEYREVMSLASRKEGPMRLQELSLHVNQLGLLGYGEEVKRHPELVQFLYDFLLTQSTKLRQLSLKFVMYYKRVPPRSALALMLPCFSEVITFVYRREGVNPDHGHLSDTLEHIFPRLDKFVYENSRLRTQSPKCGSQEVEDRMEHLSHSGVTHLSLDTTFVGGNWFRDTYAAQFPNVTRFEFLLRERNMEIARNVWTAWDSLKGLDIKCKKECPTLNPKFDLDELLTGVDASRFEELQHELDQQSDDSLSMDTLHGLLWKYKAKAGLSDLKQLQQFDFDAGEYSFRVTDIGGYFGFAVASPALQSIAFRGKSWKAAYRSLRGRDVLITEKCEAVIRKTRGPLAAISFN